MQHFKNPDEYRKNSKTIAYLFIIFQCYCAAFMLICDPSFHPVPKVQMKFSTQSMCPIEGEANVARFLFRLLGSEPKDPIVATQLDSWVDTAFFQLAEGGSKERAAVLRSLNSTLGRSIWLLGHEPSLADIACACCILQDSKALSTPANVQRWLQACRNLEHFHCITPLL